MADEKEQSRGRREVGLADQLYDAVLEGLAEILSLRQASNEVGRQLREDWEDRQESGSRPGTHRRSGLHDVRDLAFDLAELNVRTFKEMTRVGRSYSDFVWKRLEGTKRRRSDRQSASDIRQSLLSLRPSGDKYVGKFAITNATGRPAAVVLPQVLAFRKADGSDAWFAKVEQGADRPRLVPDQSKDIELAVSAESLRGREGRFLAETSVSLTGGPSLQLYVELEVSHGGR